jgi:hypothetical protein
MRIVFMLLSNSRSVAVENAGHAVLVRGFRNQDLGMVHLSVAGEQGMPSLHDLLSFSCSLHSSSWFSCDLR